MERKPHLEQCVTAHTGASDTTVCGTAPYEATSPSTYNFAHYMLHGDARSGQGTALTTIWSECLH